MVDDPFRAFETPRLLLRSIAAADTEPMSCLMTPAISRWLASWPFPVDRELVLGRIESLRAAAYKTDALPCAIVLKRERTLAGWIILQRDGNDRRRGSIGYWLGEAHHGQGYAREALSAVLALGFQRLDLDVIKAGAQPENTPSFAVMRACGMTEAGTRITYAPSRNQHEACIFYEKHRPLLMNIVRSACG